MAFLLSVLTVALFCFVAVAAGAAEAVQFQRQGYEIHVMIGGKPFTTYLFQSGCCQTVFAAVAKRGGNQHLTELSDREYCPRG